MKFPRVPLIFAATVLLLVGWCYWQATRDPLVRQARIALPDWPAGAVPIKAVLMSDLHVAGPDMPPERLVRIVARVNALRPDLVLIAGDLVSDKALSTGHYPADQAVAPLRALRAPLGTVAVLGNHDHWRDAEAFRRGLARAGVTLLQNRAVERGPLAIAGIDDDFTHHSDLTRAFASLAPLSGARVVLSHSPDIVPDLPSPVGLVMAGHTHCGQVRLPLIGRITTASRHGERFACGLIDDHGQRVIVTAGLGTSILPLRFGVPPDLWLVTLGP